MHMFGTHHNIHAKDLLRVWIPVLCLISSSAQALDRVQILDTMKRATAFMTGTVSYKGGYVWSYLPDLSRRWGEMEATKTMIWIQSPGTPAMGQLFLDAYHVTRDESYYQAAEQTAQALILAQHASGGWNYVADLESEASLRQWYGTIGRNGWRLEEFQHYYGNATFDDRTTADAATFMLRLYMEKKDGKFKAALDRAIRFVLDSQYPMGGWPQRYPPADKFSKGGRPDYSSFITFNDDVTAGNLDFLILCYQTLGDSRLREPILKAMNAFLVTQQPAPRAGWGEQYTLDLKPAGARSYEPEALVTTATVTNIRHCLEFYTWTGETRFIARIPEALDWLDSVKLPASTGRRYGSYPRFVTPETNKPLFVHRTGSNATNGRYYVDDNPENTIRHYSSFASVDVNGLRNQLESTRAIPRDRLTKNSPLRIDPDNSLPRLYAVPTGMQGQPPSEAAVEALIASLNSQGYWPSRLTTMSHPYQADGPQEVTPGDFSRTQVGDSYDTSPFMPSEPVIGISVGTYVRNMGTLIRYLDGLKASKD
jgi:PelA/Pel-15E family pectate lyase